MTDLSALGFTAVRSPIESRIEAAIRAAENHDDMLALDHLDVAIKLAEVDPVALREQLDRIVDQLVIAENRGVPSAWAVLDRAQALRDSLS